MFDKILNWLEDNSFIILIMWIIIPIILITIVFPIGLLISETIGIIILYLFTITFSILTLIVLLLILIKE
jgi:hypothetical protein